MTDTVARTHPLHGSAAHILNTHRCTKAPHGWECPECGLLEDGDLPELHQADQLYRGRILPGPILSTGAHKMGPLYPAGEDAGRDRAELRKAELEAGAL